MYLLTFGDLFHFQEASLYTIKGVAILDNDGERIISRVSKDFNSKKKKLEKIYKYLVFIEWSYLFGLVAEIWLKKI